MHFFKVPAILPLLVPSAIWRIRSSEKMIFLTFDDGPQPLVTPWVLELLDQFAAKATFFCVGNNIRMYPEIAESIVRKGHTLANHTMNHCKGWSTRNEIYQQEIAETETLISKIYEKTGYNRTPTLYFRPPYGRITRTQMKDTLRKGLKVVMWTQLSCDYDPNLNCATGINALKRGLKPGNIVVFHDSQKGFSQLQRLLPEFLSHASKNRYSFSALPLNKEYTSQL